MIRRFWRLHVLFWVILGTTTNAPAQQMGAQAAADAAQATVARLAYLEGEAHVTAVEKAVDPAEAALNMPLWPGQSLQTGRNGAAEVEFVDGSILRLTENSAATLVRLQPETQIGLENGLYYLELRAGAQPQFTVLAGEISVTPVENASFRIRVQNAQPEVAVLRGSVSVTRANSYTVDLTGGESLRTDPKNNHRYLLSDGVGSESWDHWNEGRAQQLLDAAADRTVAREDYAGGQGYGWTDLDANGTWYSMPGEGLVWQPTGADAGFDPYGYGNWVYGSAGYVWASGYNWGWLPYRCGRWTFFAGFGWAWQPASGCRSYGGGWSGAGWTGEGGGFPVNRPPHGWRPPQPPQPRKIADDSGIHIKRPTIPVRLIDGPPPSRASGSGAPRRAQPVQVGDVLLRPLAPVASPLTPHGGSAVGSALRRDFPVENATHRPQYGLDRGGPVTVPGRVNEWRAGVPDRRSQEWDRVPAGSNAAPPSAAGAVLENGSGGIAVPAWRRGTVGVNNTLRTGPPVSDTPMGASGRAPLGASGSAPAGANGPAPTGATGLPPHTGRDRGVSAPVYGIGGAGATPYSAPASPVVREPLRPIQRVPDMPQPVRSMPVAPPAPRMSAPPPTPAPPPQIHSAPPSMAPAQPNVRANPK